jgi:nucleoside-triphosphatase
MKEMMIPVVSAKKNLFVTGLPGVGKTTLIKKLSEALATFHPAGFYTSEIREEGVRKGFELSTLEGSKGLLSHINTQSPHRVGKYSVDVKEFEDFLDAIPFFNPVTHLVIIDEIGKMECFSEKFKKLLREILDSETSVIATIALKGSGFIAEIKERKDVKIFEITKKNRYFLFLDILKEMGIDH